MVIRMRCFIFRRIPEKLKPMEIRGFLSRDESSSENVPGTATPVAHHAKRSFPFLWGREVLGTRVTHRVFHPRMAAGQGGGLKTGGERLLETVG
ncbi:hypothetical protein CEXT_276491 [Caerostris extrusa]|uniref:Uncharacterized protein n=1 Tax=Caerostris extrusa TaxID=172846 RepID=A0AAV4PDN5_CAEEX|nr:hypothetical protein CEXT_276491 [Caerostris extrusa]